MATRSRIYFIIAFILFIMLGISGGLLNIAWTYMQDTFSVKLDALGVLLLFATTGSLIAAFGSGAFIGRFGLGRVLVFGVLLNMLGLIGYVIAPSWTILLIITSVLYMGRATLDAGMNNFVSVHYGASEMNWLHAGWGLGLTFAPAIITFILLTLNLSWRVGYGIMAFVMATFIIVFAMTLPQWSIAKQKRKGDSPEIEPASIKESLMQPMVRWSILIFFVYGGLEIGTGQLANTLLVEGRNIAQETSSLWISLYWGSFTIGRMIVGFIALRLSEQRILQGCFTLSLLGAGLLTISTYPIFSLLGLMSLGFGLSAIFPILIGQTPNRVGLEHSPNTIGFLVGFAGFGGAILPGIFSFLAVRLGLEIISYGILVNALLVFLAYLWLNRLDIQNLNKHSA